MFRPPFGKGPWKNPLSFAITKRNHGPTVGVSNQQGECIPRQPCQYASRKSWLVLGRVALANQHSYRNVAYEAYAIKYQSCRLRMHVHTARSVGLTDNGGNDALRGLHLQTLDCPILIDKTAQIPSHVKGGRLLMDACYACIRWHTMAKERSDCFTSLGPPPAIRGINRFVRLQQPLTDIVGSSQS